jgi:hypothetical protein
VSTIALILQICCHYINDKVPEGVQKKCKSVKLHFIFPIVRPNNSCRLRQIVHHLNLITININTRFHKRDV